MRPCWKWDLGGRLDSTNVCTPGGLDHHEHQLRPRQAIGRYVGGHRRREGGHHQARRAGHQRRDRRRAARGGAADRPATRLPAGGIGRRFRLRLSSAATFGAGAVAGDAWSSDREIELYGAMMRDSGLLGRHQAANAALVLAAVEELRRQGWTIPEAAVRRGLAEVRWPARVEVVARRPTVVLDAAHNVASIEIAGRGACREFFGPTAVARLRHDPRKRPSGNAGTTAGPVRRRDFHPLREQSARRAAGRVAGVGRTNLPTPASGRGAGGHERSTFARHPRPPRRGMPFIVARLRTI